MRRAEKIAMEHGKKKIAVIAGIGTRNYYRKLGYKLDTTGKGGFLIKRLYSWNEMMFHILSAIGFVILFVAIYMKMGEKI